MKPRSSRFRYVIAGLVLLQPSTACAWIPASGRTSPLGNLVSMALPQHQRSRSTSVSPLRMWPTNADYGQRTAAVDSRYYNFLESPAQTSKSRQSQPTTLSRFLSQAVKENPDLRDLESLFLAIQMACKTIASLVNRAGLVYSIQEKKDDISDGRFYSMKRLDHLRYVSA
jgi:hypothetical protein